MSRPQGISDDEWRARERARHHRDKEKRNESSRKSWLKNREKRRAQDKARYHREKEARKARALEWAKANPVKRRAIVHVRRSRIKKATPPWVTPEQIRVMKLAHIIASELPGKWHVDHIEPISHPEVCGLHVPWNLQIIPATENLSKGNKRGPDLPGEGAQLRYEPTR